MEWLERDINIIFIDNPTISSDYIKHMTSIAQEQDIVTKTAMESVIKLLLIVELDRAEQQRRYISKAITDGIAASDKKNGRKAGSPAFASMLVSYTAEDTEAIRKSGLPGVLFR